MRVLYCAAWFFKKTKRKENTINKCKQCGCSVNPVEAMLSSTPGAMEDEDVWPSDTDLDVMALEVIKTASIPVLTSKEPKDRLAEFYQKLGWDDTSHLEPNLVKITEEDWLYLLDAELTHAKSVITDIHETNMRIGVGMMWANTGPSGGGQTPGMVELHPGWMRPWLVEPGKKGNII